MKKRIFAFLLAVLCVVTLCPAEVLAEGIETASPDPISEPILVEEQVYINPEYADSVSPEDIPKLPKTEASDVVDLSEEYVSLSKTVAQMRSAFIDRVPRVIGNVKIAKSSVPSGTNAWNYVYDRISANIFNHTGNPEAGDYLERHFGGYSYGGGYSYDSTYYYVTLEMAPGYYTTKAQEDQVGARIDAVLDSMNLEGQSDFYIAKSIYDYICDNVTYDYDSSSNMKYTAYNAIMTGTSVCQGYATLYYRMALTAGLDARYIRGYAGGGNHGWNIVRIGDKYYNADTTWDAGSYYYSYCFVNDANFTDHTRRDQYLTSDFYAKYPMSSTNFNLNAPALYIRSVNDNRYVKYGKEASIALDVVGTGLNYRWRYKNSGSDKFSASPSVTGNTYATTMNNDRMNRKVYCIVYDAYGNAVRSKQYTLKMKTTISAQPKTTSVNVGEIISASVKAKGYKLKYQWYVKDPGQTSYVKSSSTTATYSCRMTADKTGRLVYCKITDGYGDTVKTNTVRLGRKVKITVQPTTAYAKSGDVVSTTVKAVGENLKYTWYVKNNGDTEYVKSSITGPTYSCKMTSSTKNRYVLCYVTDRYGNKVKSDTVRLRMAATITTQPKSKTGARNTVVKTSLKAAGDGLTYTWYVKNPGESSYVKSSATGNTYSCKLTSATNGRLVYCVVKDKYGKSAKSKTVSLKIG